MRILRSAALAACLCLTGCYAYRGGNVPTAPPPPATVPPVERVIAYDLRVDSNTGGDADARQMAARSLMAAMRSAGAELRPSGVPNPDYDLQVDIVARGSVPAQMLSGLVSGMTFLVVPAYGSVDVTMTAEVTGRNGLERRYTYEDSVTLWIQLFLLFVANDPDRITEELLADMARLLARDMQRDGLLPGAAPASEAALSAR